MSGKSKRRRFLLTVVLLTATGCAPLGQVNLGSPPSANFEGLWSWGSPRRSAEVPFLRISRNGSQWIIETKHFMHDYFVGGTKDVRVKGQRLEFVYWYAPLQRWARCSLDLLDNMLVGHCDGEWNARQWGEVPTYLWRSPL